MSRPNLRRKPCISHYEPEDPDLDEYVYCDECGDYVFEYCAIHGPLLVIPDDKASAPGTFPPVVPRAALTVPRVFLHLARSDIPDAGIGVFTTLALPRGVRFGPYNGDVVKEASSNYCWQIYDANRRRPLHVLDSGDPQSSNWLRYVNCARHYSEQNLIAYQYHGHLYYRTIKLIPRFTELLVFYGSEFANSLGVSLKDYNKPLPLYTHIPDTPRSNKPKLDEIQHTIAKITLVFQEQIEEQILPTATRIKQIEANSDENKTTGVDKKKPEENAKYDNIEEIKNNEDITDKESAQKNTDAVNSNRSNSNIDVENICATGNKSNCTKKHITLNTADETLVCEICDYATVNVKHLNSHLKAHVASKRYNCDFCSYMTTKNCNLGNHLRTHTGEKPYSCNVCEKKFSRKGSLVCHIRTHKGEMPYSCNVCEKKFNEKLSLVWHIKTHTGEKPYSCNVCEKKFSKKGSLICHIRTHTGEKPYSCNVCEKKFNEKRYLVFHIKTHTGENSYFCDVCNKTFTRKYDLNRHKRTHTGEKPYSCDKCANKYSDKRYLILHTIKKNH